MNGHLRWFACFLALALILPSLFSLVVPGRAQAEIDCLNKVHVNVAGSDFWDGSEATHIPETSIGPKRTIGAGITAVCENGTVSVAAGTYDLEDFIKINKPLNLVGAGNGSTIINGSSDPDDEVIGIYSSNANVLISGFTIQNGNWNGIYVDYDAVNNTITINDCVITHNNSTNFGGGVGIEGGLALDEGVAGVEGFDTIGNNVVTMNRCIISNNTVVAGNHNLQGTQSRRATQQNLGAGLEVNGTPGFGGGIAAFRCTLNLNQCIVDNNTATLGGGIFAAYNTTLNMDGCTVSGNYADQWGGGILYGLVSIADPSSFGAVSEDFATATINNCDIDSNLAGRAGGGLFILASGLFNEYLSNQSAINGDNVPGDSGTYNNLDSFLSQSQQLARGGFSQSLTGAVSLNNCAITNNAAMRWGGGMASAFSLYELKGCTFSGNAAGRLGGGIGTFLSLGELINCTISGNSLTYPDVPVGFAYRLATSNPVGDGVLSASATLPAVSNAGGGMGMIVSFTYFECDTIANNVTGSDNNSYGGGLFNSRGSINGLVNTIVANNTAVQTSTNNCLNRGTIISLGHNIDSQNSCGFTDPTDQVNTNPLLGSLANNGGPTFTCGVGTDSPAFNRGDNSNAPATDQRGVTRPQAAYCTIGAYEVGLNKSASTTVATGQGNATLATDIGGITDLVAYNQLDCLGAQGLVGGRFIFPFGYFAFKIVGLAPGAKATITITLPSSIPASALYYKCINGQSVDCTSLLGHNNGDNVLTIAITDGGLGDADGLANGTINDPGGPAIMSVTPPPIASHSSSVLPPTSATILLPNLIVQNASLSASKVSAGGDVTINATVANRGTVNGTTIIKLYVNGQEEASRSVTVESGKTVPLSFTVARSQPGNYSVYVGGVSAGSFAADDVSEPNVILFVSAGFVLAALVLGIIYMRGRRQYR
jgi:hypothetical protein